MLYPYGNSGRQKVNLQWFLPARRYASAGLCESNVSVCLSVRPSVRLSHASTVPKQKKASVMIDPPV